MRLNDSFRIAAIQASSVFLDRDACIDKACNLIREAAGQGAQLAVFPEAFVPGYPLWVWFIPPGKTHPLRKLYSELHRTRSKFRDLKPIDSAKRRESPASQSP